MLETTKWQRKPLLVDVVEVTEGNMEAVAVWTHGKVTVEGPQRFIKIDVPRALNERQEKAFVGDRVLFAGRSFKIYTPQAFLDSFDQVSTETTMHVGPAHIPPPAAKTPKKAVHKPRVERRPVVVTSDHAEAIARAAKVRPTGMNTPFDVVVEGTVVKDGVYEVVPTAVVGTEGTGPGESNG